MSTINISVDTESKNLTVSLDNTVISNVVEVRVYRGLDSDGETTYFSSSIVTREEVSPDVQKVVEYYTVGSVEAQEAIADGKDVYNDDLPGFVGKVASSPVADDFVDFFSRK
jgi:hypothetical protein